LTWLSYEDKKKTIKVCILGIYASKKYYVETEKRGHHSLFAFYTLTILNARSNTKTQSSLALRPVIMVMNRIILECKSPAADYPNPVMKIASHLNTQSSSMALSRTGEEVFGLGDFL
jgi:hypothetical protein